MKKTVIFEEFSAENAGKTEEKKVTKRLNSYNSFVKKMKHEYNLKSQKSQISAKELYLTH